MAKKNNDIQEIKNTKSDINISFDIDQIKRYHRFTEQEAIMFMRESIAKLIENQDVIYLGTLALMMGSHSEIYPYLLEKFEKSEKFEELADLKKMIDEICRSRLIQYGAKNKINPVFTMFLLKCHFNYIEPSVPKDYAELNIKIPIMTNKEAKNILLREQNRLLE